MAALRLSFSRHTSAEIENGVKALCSVIADCIENPALLEAAASTYEELYK
jgi:hypothetical protein